MDDMTDNPYYQTAYAAGCDAKDNGIELHKAMEIAETYGCRKYAYMAGWRDAGKAGE